MKKHKLSLKRRALRLYIATAFLVVYGAIILLYPKERKFEYEFKLGAPWMHDDLIAEYDFPIHKSQEQINQEKDSIRKNFISYYFLDTTIQNKNIATLNKVFDAEWKKFWEKHSIRIMHPDLPDIKTEPKNVKDSLLKNYQSVLTKLHAQGILNLPDSIDRNTYSFYLLSGEISYLSLANKFYSTQNVQTYFSKHLKYHIKTNNKQDKLLQSFIQEFKLNSIIQANVVYDQTLNDNILNNELEKLSLNSGIVQKGELIIQQGGIIDQKSYSILQSLKTEYESNTNVTNKGLLIGGISLLYLATALALFFFLKNFKPKMLRNTRRISFILLQIFIFTSSSFVLTQYTNLSIYIIPFIMVPMMIQAFFDNRTALFVHIIIVLMVGFVAPNGFEFVFIQILAGVIASFSLNNIQQRKRIFVTTFYVLLTYIILFVSIQMLYGTGLKHIDTTELIWLTISAVLLLFTIPLVWIFEKIFGFISDATLMELTDTNNPLLRQLAEKAPGTFQHSIQVSNLAEAVAREIGGNCLLIRAGALYHDVGKTATPEYFIENQSGFSPHDNLDFDESAQKIIAHVYNGIEMAKKANLPEAIIDFISTHHGTGKTQYFYRSFINKYPDREVDESKFTYPGPAPKNIENAILMMADSIEAASRTLKEYNKESISGLVEKIIDSQLNGKQFNNVDITLRQINKAKRIFTQKLLNIYHSRIEYPELNKKEEKENDEK